MFTGIVETQAKIRSLNEHSLCIERPSVFTDIRKGSSISVSGICLSVTEITDDALTFDTVPETRKQTTLVGNHPGDSVNLERALPANGRFEGHVVQGHVEGVAVVKDMASQASGAELTLVLPDNILPFVVGKGSIAVDGVSLTVARLHGAACTIALIPLTLQETTLGTLSAGDRVNIETDILAKYVRHAQN